ncbi:DUF6082 family protein [Actinoplanes subtropicus]|uniref:DUF6082 family protein n=1 Tax=Actinoplanes subtropicus TaxID=543632 RepID=UPI0024805917|nr:DUF6082 family protein [Actinoplanes subtropicus]
MRSAVGASAGWGELSDVGQAYGGVSAILSGLALCGIAGSLLLQWRQTRLAHVTAVRERHFELVKMAVEDPDLMFPITPDISIAERKRWMVLNLWVAHWAMLWDTHELSRRALRTVFDELFHDESAAAWWAARGRPGWDVDARGRRKAFQAVADEAYEAASARGQAAETVADSDETPAIN